MGIAAVLAGSSALMQTRSQNAQTSNQQKAQAQTIAGMTQSMNYSFQNLETSRQTAFDSTIDDLAKTRLQSLRQEASVNAAVNEEMMNGGRTADLLKRSVANDAARATDSIKANYEAKSNEIDLNKESSLINTKNQIAALPKIETPNALSQIVGLASSYYSGKNSANALKALKIGG